MPSQKLFLRIYQLKIIHCIVKDAEATSDISI